MPERTQAPSPAGPTDQGGSGGDRPPAHADPADASSPTDSSATAEASGGSPNLVRRLVAHLLPRWRALVSVVATYATILGFAGYRPEMWPLPWGGPGLFAIGVVIPAILLTLAVLELSMPGPAWDTVRKALATTSIAAVALWEAAILAVVITPAAWLVVATSTMLAAAAALNFIGTRNADGFTRLFAVALLVAGLVMLPLTQPVRLRLVRTGQSDEGAVVTTTSTVTTERRERPDDDDPVTTGSTSETSGAPSGECVEPGAGTDGVIAAHMQEAARAGADEDFGCLGPPQEFADGSVVQRFHNADAVLLGSSAGAAVLNGPALQLVRRRARGEMSVDGIGGQVGPRIDCWGRSGDFHLIVDGDRAAVALLARKDKVVSTPSGSGPGPVYLVPGPLLPQFVEHLREGRVLAPLGAAQTTQGWVTQRFIDPTDAGFGELLLVARALAAPTPELTQHALEAACAA